MVQNVMPESAERYPHIRIEIRCCRSEFLAHAAQDGARQYSGEPRRFRHTQELDGMHLAAQRVYPSKVAHPRDQAAGCKVVPADVA